MTDLDRQIAKIKGLDIQKKEFKGTVLPAILFFLDSSGGGFKCPEGTDLWSTSDAKAFELADEIGDPLFFLERFGPVGQKKWKAHFSHRVYLKTVSVGPSTAHIQEQWKEFSGEATTRPEAICRAYIAAMEWIKERKP